MVFLWSFPELYLWSYGVAHFARVTDNSFANCKFSGSGKNREPDLLRAWSIQNRIAERGINPGGEC
jgi:hypothetical protein